MVKYTPLFFALTSSERRLFGANLKPSGKITTAPTFKPPLLPFAKTCFELKL